MMISIKEQIDYIIKDDISGNTFVKYTNVEEFPEIEETTRKILKHHGLPNDEWSFPPLLTDGKIRKLSNSLLMVGENKIIEKKYCIEIPSQRFITLSGNGKKRLINTSIEKFIEVNYLLCKYTDEIEDKNIFGSYWENHEKYAKALQKLLEESEPQIMETIWGNQIDERFNGVI